VLRFGIERCVSSTKRHRAREFPAKLLSGESGLTTNAPSAAWLVHAALVRLDPTDYFKQNDPYNWDACEPENDISHRISSQLAGSALIHEPGGPVFVPVISAPLRGIPGGGQAE
jgi:hypothetical protein